MATVVEVSGLPPTAGVEIDIKIARRPRRGARTKKRGRGDSRPGEAEECDARARTRGDGGTRQIVVQISR